MSKKKSFIFLLFVCVCVCRGWVGTEKRVGEYPRKLFFYKKVWCMRGGGGGLKNLGKGKGFGKNLGPT